MNIKSLNFSAVNKLAFKGIENNRVNSNPISSKPDSFIKTTQTEATKKEYTHEDVQKIFNSVLLDSIRIHKSINPVINNLKLEIPNVEIYTNPHIDGVASYSFPTNTVTISEKILNEDLFLCYMENPDTKNAVSLGILTEDKLQEEVANYKKLGIETKTLKLNEKEKEFFIATSLAHEIRHFFQAHLMASTEGVSEKYKNEQVGAVEELNATIPQFNAALKQMQRDAELARRYGKPIPAEMKKILDTYKPLSYMDATYGKTYQAKQLLDPNTMFKFSVFPEDKRALTLENLYDATHRKVMTHSKSDKKAYLSNLTEIDAYNYGFEYSLAARKKFAEGTRKMVLDAISTDAQRSAGLGLKYAKDENILPSTMK